MSNQPTENKEFAEWVTTYRGQILTAHDIQQGNIREASPDGTPYVYGKDGSYVDPMAARDTDLVTMRGIEMTVASAIALGLIQEQ